MLISARDLKYIELIVIVYYYISLNFMIGILVYLAYSVLKFPFAVFIFLHVQRQRDFFNTFYSHFHFPSFYVFYLLLPGFSHAFYSLSRSSQKVSRKSNYKETNSLRYNRK